MYREPNETFELHARARKRGMLRYVAIATAFFVLGAFLAGAAVVYKTNQTIDGIYAQTQAKIEQMSASLSSGSGVQLAATTSSLSGTSEPVVAIAQACSPSVVGVTSFVKQDYSNYYSFPFGNSSPFGSRPSQGTQDGEQQADDYTAAGYGSGVIISEDGYVITNNHVVEDADKVTVTLSDGQELDATIIGTDAYSDVAILKIDGQISNLQPVAIGDSDTVQIGEMSVAIGNPLGYELFGTVTMGVISATNREVTLDDGRKMKLLQTDAAINSGNSGGGLFNSKGQLIGITSMKISSSYYSQASVEGLAFAIPINTVMAIVNELKTSGSVNYPTLGVSSTNFAQSDATQYGTDSGVMIVQVSENSPAQKAGLKAGDIITGYNGNRITNYNELRNQLYQSRIGDTVTLTIVRDKQSMDVQVTFSYENDL